MWEDYIHQYRMAAKIVPLSTAMRDLPNLPRYRVVLIDESHNLRNREGKRFRAIQEYIAENESKCILLSATPYNKTYLDLSAQLRLFVPENRDLGIRPERILNALGETEFIRRHQCPVRSLAAFEKSDYPDDWRDLMRLYLVRRTRGFIRDNYARTDNITHRKYLPLADGTRSYFPERVPKTVKFSIDEQNPADQYARLYAPAVVGVINALKLWRKQRAATDKVPAFVVLSDTHLAGIATHAPTTLDDLARCAGIGPTKLERYGDEIIAVICEVT